MENWKSIRPHKFCVYGDAWSDSNLTATFLRAGDITFVGTTCLRNPMKLSTLLQDAKQLATSRLRTHPQIGLMDRLVAT